MGIFSKKPTFIKTLIDNLTINNYLNNFNRYFEVIEATNNKQKEEAYKLRYDIYIKENGYNNENKKLDEIEKDIYDERSIIHLLYHKPTGSIAGTARIILPDINNFNNSFPLQKYCDHPYLEIEDNYKNLCQISRLCMSHKFRKRPMDGRFLPDYYDQDFAINNGSKLIYINRKVPYAPLGLIGAVFKSAINKGKTNCIWALEREQLRIMRKLGILYRTLGPRINYHGKKQPFIFNIKHVLDNMINENPAGAEIIGNKGELIKKVNQLEHNKWHDELFNDKCMDLIFNKIK